MSGSPPMPMQVRLAEPEPRQLVDGLVGERAALRHDTDPPLAADVSWDDAGLRLARRDDAGTVRPDEPRGLSLQEVIAASCRASECLR